MRFLSSRSAAVVSATFVLVSAGCDQLGPHFARASNPEHEPRSQVGSYLAGRFARGSHDLETAAGYYQHALSRDPGNGLLLTQSFLMEASAGNWARAEALAESLVARDPNYRLARLFLGLRDFKQGRYAGAEEHFQAVANLPLGELTSAMVRGWLRVAEGKNAEAMTMLEVQKLPEWGQIFLRFHKALIADMTGQPAEARNLLERLVKADARTPRFALALAHNASQGGDAKLARSVLQRHVERGAINPLARDLLDRLQAGETVGPFVTSATDGMVEALYNLGEFLVGEGAVDQGTIYLRMALYLKNDMPMAWASLASVFELTKRHEQAIGAYGRIPTESPLAPNIQIRKALNLNQLEKVDEAKDVLERLARRPDADVAVRALEALGNIMRTRKRYTEGVEFYTRAINLTPKPEKRHWSYFYSRGVCNERLKKWPQAEADFQKALQLHPDQPLVLNYLGYSWVDQNKNLKQGLALIEKAVQLKPDDGYFVDSLGWAHYRLGNFKDAARHLERAVELRPEDPVINDHLGDALWRVGRRTEAQYQWEQALTLNPEPEDAEKIQRKLAKGLPEPKATRRVAKPRTPAQRRAEPNRKQVLGRPGQVQ